MEEITSKLNNITFATSSKPSHSGKPPNIVVYSKCQTSALCLKETLLLVLEKQRYTVYILNATQMLTAPWLNNVCLLVIAGDVTTDITNLLKSYVLEGNGRLLCIGSNVLGEFVPEISGSEVEDELGTFTYSKWERVEMFHRVLKLSSPSKETVLNSITNHIPNTISPSNSKNQVTEFEVTTSGREETSQTPSFILLTSNNGGKILFSNVHLEIGFEDLHLRRNQSETFYSDLSSETHKTDKPIRVSDTSSENENQIRTHSSSENVNQIHTYLSSENQRETIKNQSDEFKLYNKTRLDIFANLLQKHFGILCAVECSNVEPDYTVGHLFGDPVCKMRFLQEIRSRLSDSGVLKLRKISLKFCENGVDVPKPSPMLLPVIVGEMVGNCEEVLDEMVINCEEVLGQIATTCDGLGEVVLGERVTPTCDGFSEKWFMDALRTRRLGRVGVSCGVMTSSMHVVDTRLVDGFIVMPRTLTRGVGRGENVWLSPEGCALFSLQIHVDSGSQFWGRLGFLQHCVTLAAVLCVRALPGCQQLPVNLKWPNDIYAEKRLKIGGAIASSIVGSRGAICNLGVGVNLFNRLPTTCINDMIDALNARTGSKVQHVTLERFVANLLNQFEQLIDMVEAGRIQEVIELYYKHWLHSGANVTVRTEDGCDQQVTIVGIDNCGFLKVLDKNSRQFSVHPDGNSFDIMSGLIAPKVL